MAVCACCSGPGVQHSATQSAPTATQAHSPRAPAEAALGTEMPEEETRWAIVPEAAVAGTAGVNKLFFVPKGHQIYCPPLCWIEIKQEYRTPFDSFSVFLIFRSYIPSRHFKIVMNRGQSTLERKTE